MTLNGYFMSNWVFVPAVLLTELEFQSPPQTRKLSYCKNDHAMCAIYGCPEKFRESLSTPTTTFAKIFNGLLFWSILLQCVQNLKFVALPIP